MPSVFLGLFMSTTAVRVEEYLSRIYRSDCDYVDGELHERNTGEYDHGRLQLAIALISWHTLTFVHYVTWRGHSGRHSCLPRRHFGRRAHTCWRPQAPRRVSELLIRASDFRPVVKFE